MSSIRIAVLSATLLIAASTAAPAPAIADNDSLFRDAGNSLRCDGHLSGGLVVHFWASQITEYTGWGPSESYQAVVESASGQWIGNGYHDGPAQWTDNSVSTSVYVSPLGDNGVSGLAELAVTFTYADPVTYRSLYHPGPGNWSNQLQLFSSTIREMVFASPTLTFRGEAATDVQCYGVNYDERFISNNPTHYIAQARQWGLAGCTSENSSEFYLYAPSFRPEFYASFNFADTGYWGASELIRGRQWSGTVQVSDGNEVTGQVAASASLEATGPTQVLEFPDPDTGLLTRRELTPYQLVFHSDGPGGGVDAVCDLVEVRTRTTN